MHVFKYKQESELHVDCILTDCKISDNTPCITITEVVHSHSLQLQFLMPLTCTLLFANFAPKNAFPSCRIQSVSLADLNRGNEILQSNASDNRHFLFIFFIRSDISFFFLFFFSFLSPNAPDFSFWD